MIETKETTMKFAMLCVFVVLCAEGCSSVASSAPEPGAAVAQFTEVSWPVPITNLPGWEQSNFIFGLPPRLTSTGGQGTALDVRSREGDTLVGLAYTAQGNGVASVQAKAYALTASGGDVLSEVFDQRRPAGFALVPLPIKAPHLMAPGEGLVIQLDAGSASYQVSSISATWTRPL